MTVEWDETGATVQVRPRPISGTPEAPARFERFTHAQIAALNDYELFEMELPRLMDAVIILTIEGRIDVPEFHLSLALEPFHHMHPWAVYRRVGAAIFIGERVLRLNTQQFELFNAYDTLKAAGTDVAARLRAWPAMADALKYSSEAHAIVHGPIPRLKIAVTEEFPARSMTRVEGKLQRLARAPNASWAMQAGYKYYLRPLKIAQ